MVDLYLIRNALRDLVSAKRVAVAATLVAGPAAIALAIRVGMRSNFDGVLTYGTLASLLVFGFVLPILSVVFGTGAVSQELEQRTMVYLLTRPVPRWRILLAKYLAAWIVISLTAVLAVLALAAVTHQSTPGSGRTRLHPRSIRQPRELCSRLQTPENGAVDYLREQLSPETRQALDRWNPDGPVPRPLLRAVLDDLNRVIASDRALYDTDRFAGISIPDDARQLLIERPKGPAAVRLNRWLIEAVFPDIIITNRTTGNKLTRDLLVLPVGAAAYGAFFLLLATLLPRALVTGLFFAFGWESWVPMMPGNFRLVSVMTYLRALSPHARPEVASTDVMEIFRALSPETVPAALAWAVLTVTTLVALALALAVFSVREYVPKDDAS